MGRFFNDLLVRTCILVHYRLESPRASLGADTFIHPRISVPLVALLGKAPVGGRPYQRDDGMGSADDCYPGTRPTQIRRPRPSRATTSLFEAGSFDQKLGIWDGQIG
jgi:hypothetical protein